MVRTALVTFALVALLAPTAFAEDHSFEAPLSLQADASGHFSGTLQITVGTGGASFAALTQEGLVNVSGTLVGDGFCITWQPEGYVFGLPVFDVLVDPNEPGRIRVEVSICADQGTTSFTAEIDIVPFTVDTEKPSFGVIKARFNQ